MRVRRSTCAWVVAGLLVPGGVAAQGIADAAKREKSRLDQAKQQPSTTYTNDSFGGSAPAQKNAKPGSDAAKTPADGTKPTTDVAEPAADGAKVAGAGGPETAAAPAAAAPASTPAAAPAPAVAPKATAAPASAPAPARVPAAAPAPASAAATTPASAAAPATAEPANSEAYWRGRAQAAQKAVDDAKARLEQLKAAGGADQTAAIEKAQRQLDSARDAQEALRAKARRAGAHADWLR